MTRVSGQRLAMVEKGGGRWRRDICKRALLGVLGFVEIARHNNQPIVGGSNGTYYEEDARPGRSVRGVLSLHSGLQIER
jgi:hypothetical protein